MTFKEFEDFCNENLPEEYGLFQNEVEILICLDGCLSFKIGDTYVQTCGETWEDAVKIFCDYVKEKYEKK